MISFDLTGKVAIVTGASQGLGKDMARGLAEAGADVVVAARRLEKLQEVAEEIHASTGRKIVPMYLDVTKMDVMQDFVGKVLDEFGKIDILVNNAALIDYTAAVDLTPEAYDKVLNANLKGPFFLAREVFLRCMKEHGGNIINICSVSGYRASAVAPTYSISKAGAIMMTQCLAAAWSQYGVYVNGIAPGQIMLGMGENSTPEHVAKMSAKVPQRRLGTVDDLNGALVFLASDACRYTQGQIILCDGGLLLPLA